MSSRNESKIRLAAVFLVIVCALLTAILFAYQELNRAPGELMRYLAHRLVGHPKLEFFVVPIFARLRPIIEKPIDGPIPTLGKGQQAQSLAPQRYDTLGRPLPIEKVNDAWADGDASPSNLILATSEASLENAIRESRPGLTIEVLPGVYKFSRTVEIRRGGTSGAPIVVRAKVPGTVNIEFSALEGFHLHAPYWIFENLVIRGICRSHSDCEHAFHVVSNARNIVIRNNRIEEFNAQIKVNGEGGEWPDDGLIQFNTLTNSKIRKTDNPVTLVDIVGANRWIVADNVIANFIKGGSDQVSYGVFMKGAGSDGQIVRNLITCTSSDISQPGQRVGISFGGGGTGAEYCRDKKCITEYSRGIVAHNVVAHCNDFGIYLNKASESSISNNALVNTYGIDVRYPTSSAIVEGNSVDGVIRSRDGGVVHQRDNRLVSIRKIPDHF